MEIFITNFVSTIMEIYHSYFFAVVKFIIGIYAVIVLVDIILLVIQRGIGGDIRTTLLGLNIPPELVNKKSKLRKKWDKVKEKMATENESNWKAAIVDADNIINDLIQRMGYPGENIQERLVDINPGQIENIEELKEAHQVRLKIIEEKGFQLSKEEAEKIMEYYENFLKYFEVLG